MAPRRFLLALAAAGALALGLSACADDTVPAASVDGSEVSQQDVVDELEAIRANDLFVSAFENAGRRVLGQEQDAFDSAFVAEQLAIRIQYLIVSNEVDRRGLEADDECRAAGRQSLFDQLSSLSPSGDGEAVFDAFPEPYRQYLIDRETDFLLLQGDLIDQPCVVDDAVADYYEAHRDEFEQACSSHILLATRDEADDVVAVLRAGADFAQVARERSVDPGSAQAGGELPCVIRGEFLPEFEEALFSQPIGEIGDPVESAAGFHVIRVTAREVPPLSEVRDQVARRIADEAGQAFQQWFVDALAAADVTVDPRYGTWDPGFARINRPSLEPASTTTTVAAEE